MSKLLIYAILFMQVDGVNYNVEGQVVISQETIKVDEDVYQITETFHTNDSNWRVRKGKRTYLMNMVENEHVGRLNIRTEGSKKVVTYILKPLNLDE